MFVPTPRSEEELFLARLPWQGRTVYDVGANIGIMALAFARAVGSSGRVVAFEPNPETIPLVADHLALNGLSNVAIVNAAVGEATGEGQLVMHREQRGTASMAAPIVEQFRALGATRTFPVQVVSLDEFVARPGQPPPDFIKVDVEGFEVACLRGMRQVLGSRQPDLMIEMHGANDDDRRANGRQVFELLKEFGYGMYNIQLGTVVDSPDMEAAARGHLFCSVRPLPLGTV